MKFSKTILNIYNKVACLSIFRAQAMIAGNKSSQNKRNTRGVK